MIDAGIKLACSKYSDGSISTGELPSHELSFISTNVTHAQPPLAQRNRACRHADTHHPRSMAPQFEPIGGLDDLHRRCAVRTEWNPHA